MKRAKSEVKGGKECAGGKGSRDGKIKMANSEE
jgi:hypothetical protein